MPDTPVQALLHDLFRHRRRDDGNDRLYIFRQICDRAVAAFSFHTLERRVHRVHGKLFFPHQTKYHIAEFLPVGRHADDSIGGTFKKSFNVSVGCAGGFHWKTFSSFS